jgi:FKBP-type peptidyl-prolyl cis-trans isomerase SlyD
MGVAAGTEVSIAYTLRLQDQTVIDTNVDAEPLTYTHGAQEIIPALEKALEGMQIGESKQVTIKPDEGYGVVDREAFVEVKKEEFPEDAVKVDAWLKMQGSSGRVFHARVAQIKDRTVVLDFNHPLAGRTLLFEVKVLDIQKTQGQ